MSSKTTKFSEGIAVKTYIFTVEVVKEDDGRWSAVIPILPGCATWGYTKEEVLQNIQEAAQAYIETLVEDGRSVPRDTSTKIIEAPAVAVRI